MKDRFPLDSEGIAYPNQPCGHGRPKLAAIIQPRPPCLSLLRWYQLHELEQTIGPTARPDLSPS